MIRFTFIRTLVRTSAIIATILTGSFFLPVPQSADTSRVEREIPVKFQKHDSVTAAIRDASRTFYTVDRSHEITADRLSRLGEIVSDHDTFAVVASYSEISSVAGVSALETSLNMPGASFEPLKAKRVSQPAADTSGDGYYVAQFGTIATDELLASLQTAGFEVVQYVPHQAFIVYGSAASAASLEGHSRIRWTGRYLPDYKVSQVLREQLNARRSPRSGISKLEITRRGTAVFDVAVFSRADLSSTAETVAMVTGGTVRAFVSPPNNFFNIVRLESPIDTIEAAASVEDVFSIEAWHRPVKEDEVAAQIVAGNYVGNTIAPPGYDPLAQFGVDGTGVTVAVVDDGVGIPGDGGFYITAGNAVNGPLRSASAGSYGHGHLQASIIAGSSPFSSLDPNGYNYGIGIAPKANIINIPLLRPGYTGTEASTVNDTHNTLGPNGSRGSISNNSFGSGLNGNAYDSMAAQYDAFVRDASTASTIDPQVIVFSAGNQGTAGLTRPKVAKNVISVGATENVRPDLNSDGGSTGIADNFEQIPDFSSRGPAADARIKPDLAAPGDAVTGGRSGTDVLFGNIDAHHRVSSGTSHAAPQVAGAAALFTHYWRNTHFGINPSPAMVKAALINGAVETTGLGAVAPRPNGSEGWGRVNLKNVLNTGAAISYFDQDLSLSTVGERRSFIGNIVNTSDAVRVSLVWTDPPAAADPALVNDLDLEVITGGSHYYGNALTNGLSMAGGTRDSRNNVENVFLPAGTSGPINVRVTARSLNGDGILGNSDTTDQHFALVVYNADVGAVSVDSGTPAVETGNALIEPNECNLVRIPLTNSGTTALTGVSATISTTTPGVSIPIAAALYPNIGPGQTHSSSTPFQISTGNTVACFSELDLTLTLTFDGAAAPLVFPYKLAIGSPPPPNYVTATTGGAAISPTGTLVTGSAVDDGVLAVTAPFAFQVYDTSVSEGSTIRVSTNGQIRIEGSGSTNAAVDNSGLPSTALGSFPANLPVLLPYWDDLDLRPTTTIGGGIFSEVTGTVGSRVWKLEWRGRNYLAGQPANAPSVNFAVYLHESSGDFEYVYALTGVGSFASGATATVGVQKATSGTVFTQFSVNSASLSPGLSIAFTRPSSCSAGFGACVSTAAQVSIAGRIVDMEGRPIRGAVASLRSPDGSVQHASTNSFGYFRFSQVPPSTYVITANAARGLRFATRLIDVNQALDDLVLVPEP